MDLLPDLTAVERAPNGIRTRVATLKGWSPGPLDDGDCLAVGDAGEHSGRPTRRPGAQAGGAWGFLSMAAAMIGAKASPRRPKPRTRASDSTSTRCRAHTTFRYGRL